MSEGAEALHAALWAGDVARVRELVAAEPALAGARDTDGVSAVARAVYAFDSDALDALLQADPPLDLFDAAMLGRTELLAAALSATAGGVAAWSADGFQPLHLAAFFGRTETARVLLDAGADVGAASHNALAVTPLNAAAAGHHPAIVALLLDRGANPDARSSGGYTPLMAAAQAGDEPTAEALLRRGADPALADDQGRTAADHARAHGHDPPAARLSA